MLFSDKKPSDHRFDRRYLKGMNVNRVREAMRGVSWCLGASVVMVVVLYW